MIHIAEITSKELEDKKYIEVFPEYYDLAQVTENGLWNSNKNVLDHVIAVFRGLETVFKLKHVSVAQKEFVQSYLAKRINILDWMLVALIEH